MIRLAADGVRTRAALVGSIRLVPARTVAVATTLVEAVLALLVTTPRIRLAENIATLMMKGKVRSLLDDP